MLEYKAKVEYAAGEKVPENLIKEFWLETGAGPDLASKIRKADSTILAKSGSDVIGFISGNYFSNLISINGFYVNPKFRGKGVGKMLLYRTIMKSKREGLGGVDIDDMQWPALDLLRKTRERCQKNPWMKISWFDDDGMGLYGEIRFKK